MNIRPFRDEDLEAMIAIQNQRRPPHLQETVAEWRRDDARRLPGEVNLRLCIGEPAIAYLSIVDRSTSAWRLDGVCSFGLWVDRAHQRQGLGSALYERVLEFARERGRERLKTYVRLFEPDEPAVAFLDKARVCGDRPRTAGQTGPDGVGSGPSSRASARRHPPAVFCRGRRHRGEPAQTVGVGPGHPPGHSHQ